jgi:hypothetical protein
LEKQQEYLQIKHMQKEEAEHVRCGGSPLASSRLPQSCALPDVGFPFAFLYRRQKEQAGKVRLHYPVPHTKWYH